MEPKSDEWRLTAYVLGELTPQEASKIEYTVASDPAVRLAVEETERAQARIAEALGRSSDTLLPRQRSAIMRAAREASGVAEVKSLKPKRQILNIWSWPVAAAAVVAAGMFFVNLITPPETVSDVNGAASNARENGSLISPKKGTSVTPLRLTLESGNKSLAVIARGIRKDRNLPASEDVKIEEMLNAFPLDAKRSVALWKGCSLGVEVLRCPWKPSSKLVFLKVRGAKDTTHEVALEYQSSEVVELGDKLVGYKGSGKTTESKPMARIMKPKEDVYLALLIDADDEAIGRLSWTVDGERAPVLNLKEPKDKDASKDARFATLVCGFGLWLRQEDAPNVDDDMLLAMAREVASESLVADRYDLLELVDQAVKLSRE